MGRVELIGAQQVLVWWEPEALRGQSKYLLGHKCPGMFTYHLGT